MPTTSPGGAGAQGGTSTGGQLKLSDLVPVAGNMTNAFTGALAGAAQARQLEQQEFVQLVEDIQRYHAEFKSGTLDKDDAQELINDAIEDTQSTLATAMAIREDAAAAAMNAAMKILEQAIQTTLSAAFTGFVFAL